jgi:hypothetical protein
MMALLPQTTSPRHTIDRRRTIEEIADLVRGEDATRRGRAIFEKL